MGITCKSCKYGIPTMEVNTHGYVNWRKWDNLEVVVCSHKEMDGVKGFDGKTRPLSCPFNHTTHSGDVGEGEVGQHHWNDYTK